METGIAKTILIFLGAAIIMAPLAKKLGFSSVIGYILGGIIIGPFVLQLTSDNTEGILHATEFGVVLLLFLVGLELEPRKFWSMRRIILGLGIWQMLLTFLFLVFVFLVAGWEYNQAIVVSICFSLSSTAMVLQILQEKALIKTVSGEAAFSTLLFQDIAFIPILAVLPLLASTESTIEKPKMNIIIQYFPDWLQPFSILVGVAILIILGKYIFVPFLRYVSKSNMSELLTAASLFLVIAVSELMITVGLSPALGAFIAGVMLANSEFRHELESHVDPFKGIFLAVFFVSVGTTIDFNVLLKNTLFIISLTSIVIIVKFIVLVLIARLFKLSWLHNLWYAFALAQVGEFAFVLLNYSNKLFLISSELNAQLIAVTAISMCVTPLLLVIYEKVIIPKFLDNSSPTFDKNPNEIPEHNKIIIVGFGHFGSAVGRLLRANNIKATILDHDSERVKLLRSYGLKVYFGDATRVQILSTAGAESAEILVLCLDNPEKNQQIVDIAKKHFPNLKIFVRAKNRLDAYELINSGVENIYRETLGTAVEMAIDILQATGMRRYAARRLGKRFEKLDKASMKKLAKEHNKDQQFFYTKEYLQSEEELLQLDSLSLENNDQFFAEINDND